MVRFALSARDMCIWRFTFGRRAADAKRAVIAAGGRAAVAPLVTSPDEEVRRLAVRLAGMLRA